MKDLALKILVPIGVIMILPIALLIGVIGAIKEYFHPTQYLINTRKEK